MSLSVKIKRKAIKMVINELDCIRLKNGREGTVVMVFTVPNLAYEVEFDDYDGESDDLTETVLPEEIEAIILSGSDKK